MEEEVDDIIGEVKYTDSQRSVATTNVYSLDFTDSCSDRHASSGKETYVIACDSESSSQENVTPQSSLSIIQQRDQAPIPVMVTHDVKIQCKQKTNNAAATASTSLFVQESFTQTSKTVFELGDTDINVRNVTGYASLETQTSYMSVTENRTMKYQIKMTGTKTNFPSKPTIRKTPSQDSCLVYCNEIFASSCDNSSKLTLSDADTQKYDTKSETSLVEPIYVTNSESRGNLCEERNDIQGDNNSDFIDSFKYESDIEPDSLIEDEYPEQHNEDQETVSNASVSKSVDNEVEELYNQLSSTIELPIYNKNEELECRQISILTPLTEESTNKNESIIDITPNMTFFGISNNEKSVTEEYEDSVISSKGYKLQMPLSDNDVPEKEPLKLPPVKLNHSCPVNPRLGFLFSGPPQTQSINRSGTLPSLLEVDNEKYNDRWQVEVNDFRSGESPLESERSVMTTDQVRPPGLLPPIQQEQGRWQHHTPRTLIMTPKSTESDYRSTTSALQSAISIQQKIKELKAVNKPRRAWTTTTSRLPEKTVDSRSVSPGSEASPIDKHCDVAEKGCENLCAVLLKRLKSSFWYEVVETLESMPSMLEKFWGVISENRIASLIRHVCAHIDSPRTQVARAACKTLAIILKNTNYTKKPDFYEAITVLLMKTGSYCRPVRSAANMALDEIASHVDVTHTVTALCLHGIDHKNPLVRCAATRVLVVCAALAGGGRGVLRSRPTTAASARTHMLRALSLLLDDKSTETRKYAERLYSILRPLPNFEAYYLTDVDIETATRQMKKHDQLLITQNGTR